MARFSRSNWCKLSTLSRSVDSSAKPRPETTHNPGKLSPGSILAAFQDEVGPLACLVSVESFLWP